MEDVQGPDMLPEENEAFERMVNQHQTALLRYCLYLRDQEQARDAVQEKFFKEYRVFHSSRGGSRKNMADEDRSAYLPRHTEIRLVPAYGQACDAG